MKVNETSKTDLKTRIDKLPLDLQARLVADVQTVIERELLPALEWTVKRERSNGNDEPLFIARY